MVSQMKMVIYSMVLMVMFSGRIMAQVDPMRVSADSSIMRLSIKDGKVSQPAAFYTVLNEAGKPISVTDINGSVTLKTGIPVTVRSYFSRDTSFIVPDQPEFSVSLSPNVIDLEEVEVTSYTVEKLMTLAGRDFSSRYPTSPLLYHINAHSYIKDRKRFLEFYQMDGLALLSGNRNWSKWSFAPGGKPEAYFYLLPLEQRMSDRFGYDGEPIPYVSYDETGGIRWVVMPFMSRPVYRGLEICGPMFLKNHKYYEFAYSYDEETDEDYVVHFKTKERYRQEDAKNIFLIGEGNLVIDKTNLRITEVNFEFSQYHDVNFEIKREGRRKDVAGEIRVRFTGTDVFYPSELEFTCYYLGENWYSPREDPVGHGIERYEKLRFGPHTKDPLKEDMEQVVRSFDFVGMNSQAGYDSDFWRKDGHVPSTLYSEISRSLSTNISLEKQFRNNSGKRWKEWDSKRDTPQRDFPEAKDFDEGVERHENLVNDIREKRFRNVYDYLKMRKDESY